MGKFSRTNECVTIKRCTINRLLFADAGFLRALNGFTAACDIAGMKISSFKTEVLHLIFQVILSNVLCKLAMYH